MPLGGLLAADNPMAEHFAMPPGAGSVIAIVATDAPLMPAPVHRPGAPGHPRAGPHRHPGSHFSGDLFLAFSTANPGRITPGSTTSAPAQRAATTSSPSFPGAS